MKKLINDPFSIVDDSIKGILKAHHNNLRMAKRSNRAIVRSNSPIKGKVAICTGGGSGHLPLFLGYVGPGLLDGVAIGNVFTSPSAEDIFLAAREIDAGRGVLFLFGNYSGDKINFEMAAEMAELEGIETDVSIVKDDIASAPRSEINRRRGVAGLFFAYKIAGAKADMKASLAEVKQTVDRAISQTCTMGVALSSCTIPAVGTPTFIIADDEMELGMGIHGEAGLERIKIKTADETATVITEKLVKDLPFESNDEVAVLINGLGATPMEELYIIYNKVYDILSSADIKIYKSYIGEYATSMEMSGVSVTLLKLDGEIKPLLNAPAFSPFLLQWRDS